MMSFEPLLSPCETYEGSRHYAAFVDRVEVAGVERPSDKKTVIMSPELLSELRAELRAQALREGPQTRPTRPSMPAIRGEGRTGCH